MGESEIAKEGGGKVGRRPTISVPPRAPFESLFAGGTMPGYSPGPMTLLANIFSPDSGSCSFSQLLAGAMISPLAKPEIPAAADFGDSKDSEKGPGYKQNKPVDLVVTQAQSPMFSFPPGLSPTGFLNSPGFLSPLQSPFGMSHQQALAHVTAQAALSQYAQSQADFQRSSAESSELSQYVSGEAIQQQQVHTLHMDPQHTLKVEVEPSVVAQPQSEHKPGSSGFDKPGNDGYNWRKYGQKIVKAKEYPRSYYKCTYACCPVKKKVEHGNDGQVTEITYKGQHNHEKPSPNPRAKDNSGSDRATGSRVKPEVKVSNEATLQFKNTEGASTQVSFGQLLMPARKDEMEDSATAINDNHEDEPNAKRRNTEVVLAQAPAPTHQTITEPKIVVQTRSEVDLLDDGFKWRKYGQKVVKGSVHPRSYYRCTFGGCNVRKHVERASLDPKSVITTYEGKHNHEIPSGRNSGQSKPQNVVARKPPPSVYKEVDFENKDQVAVLTRI